MNLLDYSNSASNWTSAGNGHPHFITLTLDPAKIKRTGCHFSVEIYSKVRGSGYDPHKVIVSVGNGVSMLQISLVEPFNPSNMDGWYELVSCSQLQAMHPQPFTTIRIDIWPNGCNCVVSGLRLVAMEKKSPHSRVHESYMPLKVGDRVTLADAYAGTWICDRMFNCQVVTPNSLLAFHPIENSGYGWCLGSSSDTNKKIGIVLAANEVDKSLCVQTEVLVFCEDAMNGQVQYGLFMSSWLQRCPACPLLQRGDIVGLNPAFCVTSLEHITDGKCLGAASDFAGGVVARVGPIRNGVQRNIEVVAYDHPCPSVISIADNMDRMDHTTLDDIWEGNWGSLCGMEDRWRSFYPTAVLQKLPRVLTMRPGDDKRLVDSLTASLVSQRPFVDVGVLVRKFGYGVSVAPT